MCVFVLQSCLYVCSIVVLICVFVVSRAYICVCNIVVLICVCSIVVLICVFVL